MKLVQFFYLSNIWNFFNLNAEIDVFFTVAYVVVLKNNF